MIARTKSGRPIENVTVNVMGPVDREVKSPMSGPTRLEGLRAGTYRVRFTHEKFITFEKEIVWRAGTAQPELSITLNAAPAVSAPPPPAPAPVVQAAPVLPKLPPPGTAKTVGLPEYIEKNFISNREPQKENLIGCSGLGQAMLWQIRDPWTSRQHESADGMLYVIGGEGRLKLGEREFTVAAGAFAVVPRGTLQVNSGSTSAITGAIRGSPRVILNMREVSVTTHRVVPIGDLPVGAGSSNAGAGAWACSDTVRATKSASGAMRVMWISLPC